MTQRCADSSPTRRRKVRVHPDPGSVGRRPAAALAAALTVALLQAAPSAAATCRSNSSVTTSFDAGSLIIPMNQGVDQNDIEKATGLIWFLLKHGIRVAWVLDDTKSAVGDKDFSISASSGNAVSKLARTSGKYDDFDTVSGSSQDYKGQPWVIPAADADAALLLIAQGTLPEDPTVQFGWELTSTFSSVAIHRAEVPFSAPVYRIDSQPPRKIALKDSDFTSNFLSELGLSFTGAEGTPSSPGVVADAMTMSQIASGSLDEKTYGVLWVGDYTFSNGDTTAMKKIASFVDAGGGLVALDTAIDAFENDNPAACSCSNTRFVSTGGLTQATAVGTFSTILEPGSPYAQIGELAVKGMGGQFVAWEKPTSKTVCTGPGHSGTCTTVSNSYQTCTTPILKTSLGDHDVAVRDEVGMGPVIYIGGHRYPGTAEQKIAIRHMVALTMFNGSATAMENNPNATELTRSSPITVENDSGGTTQIMSFQGSYEWPLPTNNWVFNASSASSWKFPAYEGHLRALDLTNLSTTADPTDFSSLGSKIYWDANTRLSSLSSSSRTIYTATGSAPLTRYALTTSVGSAVKKLLGFSSTSDADALIGQVRGAGFGGIDQATPAYIDAGDQITFQGGYTRPTVIYASAMDGMLHAFRVKDIEGGSQYTQSDWTGDTKLTELWAFIPKEMLPKLRYNDALLQASPAVADVYGDFLGSKGKPGQDNDSEWITLLALATGPTQAKAVYAIDVTNPDPSNTNCPTGQSSCVAGANPLWVAQPSGMGYARGTAIGVINTGSNKPHVFVATNDDSAGSGQGGFRVYALDATDGSVTWSKSFAYSRTIPNQKYEPNLPPPTVALVDKSGTTGTQTHLYVGDWEGKLWELDAKTGKSTQSGGGEIWDASGSTATTATHPIGVRPALYRDSGGNLHLVVVTGSIYWAPSDSTTKQKVVDIDVSASTLTVKTLKTLSAGQRIYAAPVVSNEDIFVIASQGLVDVASEAAAPSPAAGTAYRINATSGTVTSFSVSMSGSSASVTESGKIVLSSTQGAAVRSNSGGSTTDTNPGTKKAVSAVSKLRLWLPQLD